MAEPSPHRELVTAPLLRRESIGEHYHVLTFDVPRGIAAHPGQFTMLRGAEWGDAPLLPRPMSYLTAGATPSVLIKVSEQAMQKMFTMMPGFGEGMNKMFTELGQNKTVMLRTQMKLYSSMFGQVVQSMQKAGKELPPGYDPDAPLVTVSQEAQELSTAPVDEAMFRMPEGHQTVPMADLMKALAQPKTGK